jgi:hypothetical protein
MALPMRRGEWLLMLVLVFALALAAAPALADDPSKPPYPETAAPEKKPAAKPRRVTTPAPAAAVKNNKPQPAKTEAARPDADAHADAPADQRPAIEAALMWSGDYSGIGGNDDPMLAAIKNFQKRSKAKITGTLTPTERASLVAAAKQHEEDYGWSIVADPATGARLGVPLKLTPQAGDAARGTRWSSAHGEMQVETFRIKDGGDLAALFEKEKKEPGSRRVESSALHPGDFTIAGMQGLKRFQMKAQARDGEVRGVTVLYDQAMEGIVAPVLGAMTSAFTPFPQYGAPFARPVKPVDYGTGLVISGQGHIVTDRKLAQGCQVIVAAGLGDADRVADDPDSGLALLRVYGARKVTPLPLANAPPQPGDVTLVGIADPKEQDGRKSPTEIKARLAGGNAIELREPAPMAGFTGAAALDGSGKFLGMAEMRNAVLASAGSAPAPLRLIPASIIRAFLEARDVAPSPTQGGDARAAIVRIICVRK